MRARTGAAAARGGASHSLAVHGGYSPGSPPRSARAGCACPAGRARPPTGEDPGDALGDGRVVQGAALGRDRRDRHDLVARAQDLPKRLAPLHERLGQEGATVEMQDVESEERGRPPRRRRQPGLQRRRIGAAARIDHDQLPVEQRRSRRDANGHAGQLGEAAERSPPSASTTRTAPVPGQVGRPDEHERPVARPTTARTGDRRVERLGERARLLGRDRADPAGPSVSSRSDSWSDIVRRW